MNFNDLDLHFNQCHPHGNMPALEGHVTRDFHKWLLRVILSNHMDDPWYQRKQGINPFFQGGSTYQSDGWIFIEFWTKDIKAVQKFINDLCFEYLKRGLYD